MDSEEEVKDQLKNKNEQEVQEEPEKKKNQRNQQKKCLLLLRYKKIKIQINKKIACSLPPEFCMFQSNTKLRKCQEWLRINNPKMYIQLYQQPQQQDEKKEGDQQNSTEQKKLKDNKKKKKIGKLTRINF
ncbi:hypothetical protein IMG5_049580 [Ichthyophthirius multifiliis]|uniref:DENR N-terminal domain-containing protein n=1 Tax=Ichthyophthirius multifiliis TaxID=5932 RepID=G0QMK7_ICHMU|nr:hypothetical protein IMG5_049580 [Ichthyophthirius multifiliis]EGR33547.1 hypothetical protein IMG5_049580 [Ichthyophthirius multifiliis]|eukprot:XP_004037533.1 hypothetical protein IMG5_049580 [Ichthyophthirius multifiliis]